MDLRLATGRRPRWPAPSRLGALLLVLLGLSALSAPTTAPVRESPDGPGTPLRFHVGMWTSHLMDLRRGLDANWLLAIGWRGVYGGTFVNSFGDRAFAAGIERSLTRHDEGDVRRGLGYRLGVVSGYDERLMSLAGKTPLLPAIQITGDLAVAQTGVEVDWSGKIASIGPFFSVRD